MVPVEFGLLTLAAYLLGSVPAAYLAAKWSRGVDITRSGAGGAGAGNVWRLTSKRLAIAVVIFDLGKGMPMVWAARAAGLGAAGEVAVGLTAIAGHNWPVFLRFRGGRGVLTTVGVALILPLIDGQPPWGVIIGLAMVILSWLTIHDTSPALGIAFAALPLISWWTGEPLAMTLGFLAMFLMMVVRRLTAPGLSKAPVPTRQLFVNRLIFDRDIRDREAWLRQTLPGRRSGS